MFKYTITEKIASVALNLIMTNRKDYVRFFASFLSKKYNLGIYTWDITQDKDYDERDYTLDGNESPIPTLSNRSNIYLFDQGQEFRTRNSCVPLNIYLAFCHTLGITPDYKYFRDSILPYLESNYDEQGNPLWMEARGASVPKVINALRTKWNTDNPDRQVITYRDSIDSPRVKEALEKWYRLVARYGTRPAYNKDRDDNGKIDLTKYDESETGWHIVSVMTSESLKGKDITYINKNNFRSSYSNLAGNGINIVDSYPVTRARTNIYTHNLLKEQYKSGIFSEWVYTITEKEPVPVVDNKGIYTDIPKTHPDYELSVFAKSINMQWDRNGNLNLNNNLTRREYLIMKRREESEQKAKQMKTKLG